MGRNTLLLVMAVAVLILGALILLQKDNSATSVSSNEGTRVEAPGTTVESDKDQTRIEAPGVDITVPRDKNGD
jgi:hypothetical protein